MKHFNQELFHKIFYLENNNDDYKLDFKQELSYYVRNIDGRFYFFIQGVNYKGIVHKRCFNSQGDLVSTVFDKVIGCKLYRNTSNVCFVYDISKKKCFRI